MRPDSAEEKDDLELGMEQPSSQNINPNNALHPYGAQSAPRVNANVGHMNNRLPRVQWTFHIVNAKKCGDTVTWKPEGQGRTAENKMNSPTRRCTVQRTKCAAGER